MQIKEFLDLIDETAQKEGFENEFLILVADKNGKISQWTHVWNDNFKQCGIIHWIKKFLVRRSFYEKKY